MSISRYTFVLMILASVLLASATEAADAEASPSAQAEEQVCVEGECSAEGAEDDGSEAGGSAGSVPTSARKYEEELADSFARERWTTAGLDQNKTIHDLWWNLGCDELFKKARPIPTREQFDTSIALYNEIQTDETLRIDPTSRGIFVEVEVKQAGEKGRGVFAVKDIPEGSEWRSSYDYTAVFYEGEQYRKFILGLETGFACDVLQWAYAEYDTETNEPFVAVDLDEATMCNDGGGEGHNVGCDYESETMQCGTYEYSIRDIKAGEEVLCYYGDFSALDAWADLELE